MNGIIFSYEFIKFAAKYNKMSHILKRTHLSAFAVILSVALAAQPPMEEGPKGWHLGSQKTNGYYGINLDKAYEFVASKKLKSNTVIVAVLDTGIDTTHEDLKSILWTNPKEIPGNGIDDDKNGYVDDIHGWNFLGGKDGRNVKDESYEAARVYHQYKDKYKDKEIDESKLSADELYIYKMWKRADKEVNGEGDGSDGSVDIFIMRNVLKNMIISDSILKKAMGKEVFTGKELKEYIPTQTDAKKARSAVLGIMEGNDMLESTNKDFMEGFTEFVTSEEKKAEAKEKAPKPFRDEIVKDNYNDINDKFYGNNDIMAKTALHGTHVSGLIGAVRNNGKGVDGIADNVRVMMVRMLTDAGDEHDKDVALAIRYAVDNGARIINMSFGKDYSPEKKWVDDAVRYAESKGVLLVHAAGNDSKNIDTSENYPSPSYLSDKKRATNWITVGASGDPKFGGLAAVFSNYGKKEVDVFAPGVKIYSTVPGGNTYSYLDGTSFASPIVAGTAAFLLSYYPSLSAQQLKTVIEKSAQHPDIKATKPGTDELVSFSELSRTGGLLNAYEAAKLASTMKGERNQKPPVKTKSTVKPKAKG